MRAEILISGVKYLNPDLNGAINILFEWEVCPLKIEWIFLNYKLELYLKKKSLEINIYRENCQNPVVPVGKLCTKVNYVNFSPERSTSQTKLTNPLQM